MAQQLIHAFVQGRGFHKAIGDGFGTSFQGQRFAATHQTPTTDVTGQTSFDATTPTFLFYQTGAASRLCLSSMQLSQSGTVAGGDIFITLAVDNTNRYASLGTLVTPQNMNAADTTAANVTFRYNPTATAAGSGTRYLGTWVANADTGIITTLDFQDAVQIGVTGSILVYTWAATTAPSWKFVFELAEFTT